MNQVEKCTRDLKDAIIKSEAYQDFLEAKEKVARQPELRKQINEFRKLNYETQNSEEILDAYQEIDKISREYQELRKNPLVEDFLSSELSVCRMMQKISRELITCIDLDTEELL